MRNTLCGIATGLAMIGLASAANAQDMRGTIVDSASRRPIAGAVFVVMDAARLPLARGLSNERGEFRIPELRTATHVRVVRLGFRAREIALPPLNARSGRLNIAMITVPALLSELSVTAASRCPRRSDAREAFALLEQARSGLLATIVAREANPAALKVLAYDRTLDGSADRIEKQTVRIDSSGSATTSFTAVQSAADFVRLGFVREQRGLYTFLGPDAETLLDNEFTAGYCFRVHEPDGARVDQVGLAFEPAARRRGRVDIAGTLWVDTAARALRDIDFTFVGTGKQIGAPEPGGHIWFREMPNGVVLIDRWFLRLTGAGVDTLERNRYRGPPIWENYLHDIGGEVARASWPDGQSWRASLGTLRLHLDDQFGRPERSQSIRLDGTDYTGKPDSAGNIVIPDLLPGPYSVVVVDAVSGVTMPTNLAFIAQRDRVMQFSIVAPSAERFQKRACLSDRRNTWTIGRAQRLDGTGVASIRWDVGIDLNDPSEIVFASGKTAGDGTFGFCSSLLRDRRLRVRVADNGAPQQVVIRSLEDVASSFTVVLPY